MQRKVSRGPSGSNAMLADYSFTRPFSQPYAPGLIHSPEVRLLIFRCAKAQPRAGRLSAGITPSSAINSVVAAAAPSAMQPSSIDREKGLRRADRLNASWLLVFAVHTVRRCCGPSPGQATTSRSINGPRAHPRAESTPTTSSSTVTAAVDMFGRSIALVSLKSLAENRPASIC